MNISDCNMGCENVTGTLRALKKAKLPKLKWLGCNYNDVESSIHHEECLETLLEVMGSKDDDENV